VEKDCIMATILVIGTTSSSYGSGARSSKPWAIVSMRRRRWPKGSPSVSSMALTSPPGASLLWGSCPVSLGGAARTESHAWVYLPAPPVPPA